MNRMEELIDLVESHGIVMNFNIFQSMKEFDETIKKLSGQFTENIIYCSPEFLEILSLILKNQTSTYDTLSYGHFNRSDSQGGMGYLVDLGFKRGDYEFYVVTKPMVGALMCPVTCPDVSFAKNSIRINLNHTTTLRMDRMSMGDHDRY